MRAETPMVCFLFLHKNAMESTHTIPVGSVFGACARSHLFASFAWTIDSQIFVRHFSNFFLFVEFRITSLDERIDELMNKHKWKLDSIHRAHEMRNFRFVQKPFLHRSALIENCECRASRKINKILLERIHAQRTNRWLMSANVLCVRVWRSVVSVLRSSCMYWDTHTVVRRVSLHQHKRRQTITTTISAIAEMEEYQGISRSNKNTSHWQTTTTIPTPQGSLRVSGRSCVHVCMCEWIARCCFDVAETRVL